MSIYLFQTNDKGKSLLDRVCDEINLVEKDYFGLRYVDIDKERVSYVVI